MATSHPQQGGSDTPAQQPTQQGSTPAPQQQQGTKPIFKDWASI